MLGLVHVLGGAAFAGLGVMLALLPLQLFLSHTVASLRAACARAADTRLKLLEAAVQGHKAIKLSCWEGLSFQVIRAARRAELKSLQLDAALKALNVLCVTLAPTLVSLASFSALALANGI